ncbi:MAG: heavy-metal-associated domain-containing protein [Deltaproteobacteria bacterium]|jgi:hypothetical protein|nr:heavy-metal-associated domain-containing protein [Deltaproteobacteria bacterium]
MITSYTRGRIRLRLEAVKGAPLPEMPKEGLKGVKSLAVNPKTGSALLEYDPEVLSVQTIASFVEAIDPGAAEALLNPHLLKPRTLFPSPVPSLAQCPPPITPVPSPDAPPQPGQKAKPRLRGSAEATSELFNLGVAFLGTILSGFFSSRRLHVQLGVLSGLMMVGHAWKHRKRLRPLSQMTLSGLLGLPKMPSFGRPYYEEDWEEDPQEALAPQAPQASSDEKAGQGDEQEPEAKKGSKAKGPETDGAYTH